MTARVLASLLFVGCACIGARADVPLTTTQAQPWIAGANQSASRPDLASNLTLEHINWLLDGAIPVSSARITAPDVPLVDERSSESVVSPLPPSSGSTALALWALGSLGALQAGRSLRRAHLGVTPDWYHTDARCVGGAVPLSLDFDRLPVQVSIEPTAGSMYPHHCPPPSVHMPGGQWILPQTSPRAPPAICC